VGGHRLGKLTAAALIGGCALLVALIVLRDCAPSPQLAPSTSDGAPPQSGTPAQRRPRHTETVAAAPVTTTRVTVRVVAAENGSPIAGATVNVPEAIDERLVQITDANGLARFGPLVPHEWRFRASADGRVGRWAQVLAAAQVETSLDIVLEKAVRLDVLVQDAVGAPVPEARVVTDELDGAPAVSRRAADGRVTLLVAANAVIRIAASATDFGDAATIVRAPVEDGLGVPMRLAPPGTLVGTVRGPDGALMARARVIVAPANRPVFADDVLRSSYLLERQEERIVTADAAGSFRMTGLVVARRWHAMAIEGDTSFPRQSAVAEDLVPTAARPEVRRDLALQPFATLNVSVVDGDAPVNDAWISVNGRSAAISRTAAFDHVAPGVAMVPSHEFARSGRPPRAGRTRCQR
jgi:hypothetical protein